MDLRGLCEWHEQQQTIPETGRDKPRLAETRDVPVVNAISGDDEGHAIGAEHGFTTKVVGGHSVRRTDYLPRRWISKAMCVQTLLRHSQQ